MKNELLALYIPRDTHHDTVDAAIKGAFGSPTASFSPDGQIYHFPELHREGDSVRHIETGREMTITELALLLQEHCAFVRKSTMAQDDNGKLYTITS